MASLRRNRRNNRYASTIRARIVGLFAFAVLALLAANMALYRRAASIITAQTVNALINNLSNVVNSIDRTLESLDIFAVSTNLNQDLRTYLSTGSDISEYQRYVVTSRLLQLLNEIRFSHAAVDSVYAYSAVNDSVYSTDMVRSAVGAEIAETEWYELFTGRTRGRWMPLTSLHPLDSLDKNLLASVTPIRNRAMTDQVGAIAVNVNERYLRRFFDGITIGAGVDPFLIGSDGALLSHRDQTLIGTRYAHSDLVLAGASSGGHAPLPGRSSGIVLFATSVYTGWRCVAEISMASVNASIVEVRDFTLVLGAIALLLASIPIVLVSRGIVSPIRRLADHMDRAGRGDLSPSPEPERKDEFGVLFRSFNEMVANASAMIDDLYVQKLLKNEMQLRMIQSQINSHFLYNTLDAIHWAARDHGLDDVCRMTQGLAGYLRKNLSDGKESLPVRDVASLLKSYIAIQNIRYENRFLLDLRVDPELLDQEVLKFLFQPLLENAVIHGFDEEKQRQTIRVVFRREDANSIAFTVSDDGHGVAPERLAEIQADLAGSDRPTGRGFALKNVHSLIKLYYGREYGLTIGNLEDGGAEVRLLFPTVRPRR